MVCRRIHAKVSIGVISSPRWPQLLMVRDPAFRKSPAAISFFVHTSTTGVQWCLLSTNRKCFSSASDSQPTVTPSHALHHDKKNMHTLREHFADLFPGSFIHKKLQNLLRYVSAYPVAYAADLDCHFAVSTPKSGKLQKNRSISPTCREILKEFNRPI